MPNDTSDGVEMMEASTDECLCEDPLQDYRGEPLVTCPVCCLVCSEATAEHAWRWLGSVDEPYEGDTSWLYYYMC